MSKFAALLALLGAAAAPGSDGPGAAHGDLQTVVEQVKLGMIGEWAEYAALRGGRPDFTDVFRFSLLADEDPKSPPWVEIWMDKLGRTAARMRRGEKVGGQMFFKMGSAIYSVGSFASINSDPNDSGCAGGECKSPAKGGRAWTQTTLQTSAGLYKCRYAKIPTNKGPIEVWYADGVPATRLARVRLADGTGYELVASGKAAISSFPRKFSTIPLPLENLKVLEALAPKVASEGAPDGGLATDGGR